MNEHINKLRAIANDIMNIAGTEEFDIATNSTIHSQSDAWFAVARQLQSYNPHMFQGAPTGAESAVKEVERLQEIARHTGSRIEQANAWVLVWRALVDGNPARLTIGNEPGQDKALKEIAYLQACARDLKLLLDAMKSVNVKRET